MAVLPHGVAVAAPAAVLAHRELAVLAAVVEQWDVTLAEADALFEDLMAWLWLLAQPDGPRLVLEAPMRIVDEVWHAAILDTPRYAALCAQHLGRFVHHVPSGADPAVDASPHDREAQLRYIAAQLGVDRLLRWYVELPLRHDDAWFRTARRVRDHGYTPPPTLVAAWRARRGAA